MILRCLDQGEGSFGRLQSALATDDRLLLTINPAIEFIIICDYGKYFVESSRLAIFSLSDAGNLLRYAMLDCVLVTMYSHLFQHIATASLSSSCVACEPP